MFLLERLQYVFTTTDQGQTACGEDTNCPETVDPTDPMMAATVDPLESWEPWPHGPGGNADVIGGIQDPVDDSYLRLSLAIGYALR